jgi:hypothetical protein
MSPGATRALEHCGRIRDLILHRAGGWADADALRRFRRLSYAAACAADDADCAELMQLAEQYAADLFSEENHRRWARGRTSGADVLRLCILGKLAAFRERVGALALHRVAAVDRDRGAGDEVGSPAAEEHRDP